VGGGLRSKRGHVFTLQSEIAQKIARKLGAGVSSAEKNAIQEPPTTDLISLRRVSAGERSHQRHFPLARDYGRSVRSPRLLTSEWRATLRFSTPIANWRERMTESISAGPTTPKRA